MAEQRKCKFKNNFPSYERCGKSPLQGSEFCLYHKPDKTKEEMELFKEGIRKKLKNKDYNFSGFVFPEDVDFENDFEINVFEKRVDFRKAQFKNVDFWGVLFEDANFEEARFEKAKFSQARFEKANFWGAQFQEANFIETRFEEANFWGAQFQEAFFVGAQFYKEANFKEARFEKIASILPLPTEGEISFAGALIENVLMTPLNLKEHARIDFKNARLRNTEITRRDIERHIKQEQEGDFAEAKEVYLRLKNNFYSLGRYDDQSWAFQKEKEMERKSYFKNKYYFRWVWSKFLSILYGYGERPERPLLIGTGAVFFFAFLFRVIGISDLAKQSSGNIWDCLYFSVVTFTTLGYGDVRPLVGIGRIIAGIEAFTGVILIALFIFTFARRTGGR